MRTMRNRLHDALVQLWPATAWTPAEAGVERIYQGRVGVYLVAVEWQAQTTTLVLARVYDQHGAATVSVLGVAAGMSVEAIRRAFVEAVTAWIELQTPPPLPRVAVAVELAEDSAMFATYGPRVSDV